MALVNVSYLYSVLGWYLVKMCPVLGRCLINMCPILKFIGVLQLRGAENVLARILHYIFYVSGDS